MVKRVPLDRGLGPSRCRDCGGRIVWALTDKDKRMAVDAQTVLAGGAFVLWFDDDGEGDQRVSGRNAYEVQTGRLYEGPLWTAHFATCPERQRGDANPTGKQLTIWAVLNGGRQA